MKMYTLLSPPQIPPTPMSQAVPPSSYKPFPSNWYHYYLAEAINHKFRFLFALSICLLVY